MNFNFPVYKTDNFNRCTCACEKLVNIGHCMAHHIHRMFRCRISTLGAAVSSPWNRSYMFCPACCQTLSFPADRPYKEINFTVTFSATIFNDSTFEVFVISRFLMVMGCSKKLPQTTLIYSHECQTYPE